jgi:transposase-like protein
MPAHLLLTPELAQSLANAVRKGVPIETAAQAAGVSPQQFYAWLRTAEHGTWPHGTPVDATSLNAITAFAEQIRTAQAEFEAHQVENVAAAAEMIGKSGVREWRAGAWLLNNHPRYRERYRQHREVQVEQSGTVKHEHTLVRNTDPNELEEWHTALKALPEVER